MLTFHFAAQEVDTQVCTTRTQTSKCNYYLLSGLYFRGGDLLSQQCYTLCCRGGVDGGAGRGEGGLCWLSCPVE